MGVCEREGVKREGVNFTHQASSANLKQDYLKWLISLSRALLFSSIF